MKNKAVKGKNIILTLVLFILGFMLAFSYNLANKKEIPSEKISDPQFARETELRNELIRQQKQNSDLQSELYKKQNKVRTIEKNLSKEKKSFYHLAEDAEKYRMYLGKMKVEGKGVTVTLQDGEYDPHNGNVNSYLVHDFQVFKVINELYIAGASAVAINGLRIKHDSYIICNGPVITVDGAQFPAPFKISAIGDPNVLASALTITGGIKDQLVNDNILFSIEKKNQIIMNPILSES
ncbi:DUF881 domain-containing protein [Bacillus sp. FJAT-49736]|uniref:DUF881 domain-containing protein n=1 Tax=Bacillus sp. FJAT-49736 TaxID=2833582 RepID=UPI001BC9F068|nr:DUF881 domain-containing protein [Bacillus sp. FJAT-49736]MBS4172429.1 DUF881 domain-containing protein [Bacillus sp. FJAT-49736]